MPLNKDEILELLSKAKDLGVAQVEVEGLKVSFGSTPIETIKKVSAPVPESKPEELIKPLSQMEEPTDDEVLYWSTPYYDQLQTEKEQRQKAIREGEVNE